MYLAFAVDKGANYHGRLSVHGIRLASWQLSLRFSRQALPMMWDYAEANPFIGNSSGNMLLGYVIQARKDVRGSRYMGLLGSRHRLDASDRNLSAKAKIVSTDPPYYDNIGICRSLGFLLCLATPARFGALSPIYLPHSPYPRLRRLVAFDLPAQWEQRARRKSFFMNGMTRAMRSDSAEQSHPAIPGHYLLCVSSSPKARTTLGTTSTGWETFLDAV